MTATSPLPVLPTSDRSRVHYQNFHNIFLYITERCQLRCGHCYMGDRLERGLRLSLERARYILRLTRNLGARYVTLLGGEPTLHKQLTEIVCVARQLGYEQVMIDTNGLHPDRLFEIPPDSLYYISVSLDGASAASHEQVRGEGTYSKTVDTIRRLCSSGYHVRINCTVFRFNAHEAEAMLRMADGLGVRLVNFHSFSAEGYGRDKETWSLTPREWITFYERLEAMRSHYRVSAWYPPTWSTAEDLERLRQAGFSGCLGTSLDRLSIFPDGRCYVCSVLFDEAVHFAQITDSGFELNRRLNEFDLFAKARAGAQDPCRTGCPAEARLGESSGTPASHDLISVCRCWKVQT